MNLQLLKKKQLLVAIRFMFLLFLLIPVLSAGPAKVNAAPTLLWETVDANLNDCSPAVGSDGTVYVSNPSNKINETEGLYAFRPDGTIKWVFEKRINTETTPVIADDGTIYFTAEDSVLYAVNPDGTEKWAFSEDPEDDFKTSPAIGYDGSIYVGTYKGFLYAVSPNGELSWKHATGNTISKIKDYMYSNIESSPVVGKDGTIYLACKDSYVYAISPEGLLKWGFKTSYINRDSSPAIGADGTIYHGNLGNRFYAINPDGTEKWNIELNGYTYGSAAVAADGSIYAGTRSSSSSVFYKFTPDGTVEWEYMPGDDISSSVVIGHEGTVIVAAGGDLYAFNPDGSINWMYQMTYWLKTCPVLTADGTMYLCCESLTALETDILGYQQDAPWPGYTYSTKRSIADSSTIITPELHTVQGYVTQPDLTPMSDIYVSIDGQTVVSDSLGHVSFAVPDGSYSVQLYVYNQVVPQTKDVIVDGGDVFFDLYEGPGSLLHEITGRVIVFDGALGGAIVTNNAVSTATNGNGIFSFQVTNGGYSLEIDAGENRFPSVVDLTVEDEDVDIGDFFVNTIDWTYTFDSSFYYHSPVVGPSGIVYFNAGEQLTAVTPDGAHSADVDLESDIYSVAVSEYSGTVYITMWDAVNAYNADLSFTWEFPVLEKGAGSAPAVATDGTVYFGAIDKVYALTQGGDLKWSYYIGDRINASPTIGPDGTVYVTNSDKNIYALNPDGTLQWKYITGGFLSVSPVIGEDGTIYFGSYDNYFYALNPDGTLKWKFEAIGAISSDATIGSDGTIYVTCQLFGLYALNPDGTLRWEFIHDDGIDRSLWLCPHSGEIWLHDMDETIVLNSDGTLAWRSPTVYMAPTVTPGGCMYAVTESRETRSTSLHAIRVGSFGKLVTAVENDHVFDQNHPVELLVGDIAVYPNPFNPATILEFELFVNANVTMEIYSITGQKVVTLIDRPLMSGMHTVHFDGSGLSSGVYFARLVTGNAIETKKMLLVK